MNWALIERFVSMDGGIRSVHKDVATDRIAMITGTLGSMADLCHSRY